MPQPAFSHEQVIFDNRIGGATELYLSEFTKKHLKKPLSDYDIAKIDLNGDFYDEYALKPKNCKLDARIKLFCTFILIGEEKEKLIQLFVISAKKIAISTKKHNGIYDILAFDSKKNDYDYGRYIWSPDKKTYIKKVDMTSVDNGI